MVGVVWLVVVVDVVVIVVVDVCCCRSYSDDLMFGGRPAVETKNVTTSLVAPCNAPTDTNSNQALHT